MIRHFIQYIVFVGSLVALTGCNGDIFADRIDVDDDPIVYVRGDGGEWSSPISTRGLKRIYINFKYDDKQYVTYYGANGTVDENSPASELKGIVYENPARYYDIGFLGDMVYFTSNYNALDAFDVSLNLEYEDGMTSRVRFFVEAGERLEYGGSFMSGTSTDDNVQTLAHRSTFNNNGPIAQKFVINPYMSLNGVIDIMTQEPWTSGLKVDLSLPVYTGTWWSWENFTDVVLNERMQPLPLDYGNETFTVDVPANTKAIVDYAANISRTTVDGILLFNNKVSDRQITVDYTAESYYPTSYVYNVTLEDL